MGENKEIKVRLSTVVYLFIILVLVVALGVVYYLGFVKNDNANNMIVNGEVAEKNNISVNEQVPETNNNVDKIAKDLFEKGSKKIRETQYTDYYQYESAQPVTEKTINGVTYQKRNVLYANVEKEYSEIFTGEALTNVLGKRFTEVDGYLYVSYGGATGWDVTNIKLSRISENSNGIEYTVTYNDVEIDDSISEEYSCKMTVKLVDGNYRISEIDYLGLDNSRYYEIINILKNTNNSEEYFNVLKINYENEKYNVEVEYNAPVVISENEFSNLKKDKEIILNNEKYEYITDNDSANGYIQKNNQKYEVINYNNGYAFELTGTAGGYTWTINKTENMKFVADEDTVIYDSFAGQEYKLKDNKAKDWLNKSLKNTIVRLNYTEDLGLSIFIDNK